MAVPTVRYGDISPNTEGLRFWTVIWILVGIVFVFSKVSNAVCMFTKKLTDVCRGKLEELNPPDLVDSDGNGSPDFAMPESAAAYYSKSMLKLPSVVLMFGVQIPFAGIFISLEDEWSFSDAGLGLVTVGVWVRRYQGCHCHETPPCPQT